MAKIIIDVLASNLSEVLSNLTLNHNFSNNVNYTLELEIVDTKENFEYLAKSDKIRNWNFNTENSDDQNYIDLSQKTESNTDTSDCIDEDIVNNPVLLDIFNYFNHTNFETKEDNILHLIYLSWFIKKGSPINKFTLSTLLLYINSQPIDILDIDIKTVLDSDIKKQLQNYYKNWPFELILEDTIIKLSKLYNKLDSLVNFNSVVEEFLRL